MKKYSQQHEWIILEGEVGVVGITDYAQHQLGDVVFAELPALGQKVEKGGQVAVVESVKAASEVYSPVSGEVVEVNSALQNSPDLINNTAESDGWFFKVKLSNSSELDDLMNETEYNKLIGK